MNDRAAEEFISEPRGSEDRLLTSADPSSGNRVGLFFIGKRNQKIPFPVWTVFSSVLFAMWHFSQHAIPIVLFGISTNFVCSLIFCPLFQRTGNSMISTIAHVIGNYAEVFLILLAF